MKIRTRTLILAICAVFAMTTTVFGTIAYLTGTDTVTNTFTVGKVEIDLDETKVTPEGDPTYEDGNVDDEGNPVPDRTDEGNDYHLIPGKEYTKDPTVTVKADSEEAYVRMMVTLTSYTALTEALGADFDPAAYAKGMDNTLWVPYGEGAVDAAADTITYELRYFQPVAGADADVQLPAVFTGFEVPGTITGEQLAKLAGTEGADPFKIIVTSHAIQTETFATEDEAWAAFDAQVNTGAAEGAGL